MISKLLGNVFRVALAAVLVSCSDGSDDPACCAQYAPACLVPGQQADCGATAEIREHLTGKLVANGEMLTVDVSDMAMGYSQDIQFDITNVAKVAPAALEILSIGLEYTMASPDELDGVTAFACWNGDASKKCMAMAGLWGKVVPEAYADEGADRVAQASFVIRYTRMDDQDRQAKIRIQLLNDRQIGEFVIRFRTKPST